MNKDSETLHYMRGKLDSLHELVEGIVKTDKSQDRRIAKVERNLHALWFLGPVLTGLAVVGYTVKKLFLGEL